MVSVEHLINTIKSLIDSGEVDIDLIEDSSLKVDDLKSRI